jgi:hypothetical protein
MKTIIKKIALISFIATVMLFVSCEVKDDSNDTNTDVNYSAENTARAAQTDNVVEGTFNIIDNGYVENDGSTSSFNNISLFSSCTTITFIPNGDSGTIILDFGESCQLNNGSVVSGIIRLEYGPFVGGTRTINYTFENYFYNNNGVTGGGEIYRQIANQNGNPQSTVNESITVSFPNTEVTATRNGLRITEWIEGIGNGTWTDNVYSITGNWDTTITNGFERTGEVTEPVIVKLNCLYVVSGRIAITQEGLTGIIDYGDGTCDNEAVLIINGQEYPILM